MDGCRYFTHPFCVDISDAERSYILENLDLGGDMLMDDDTDVVEAKYGSGELVSFDRLINTMIQGDRRILVGVRISMNSLILRRPRDFHKRDWHKILIEIPTEDYASSNWIEARLEAQNRDFLELRFIRISYRARVRIRQVIENHLRLHSRTIEPFSPDPPKAARENIDLEPLRDVQQNLARKRTPLRRLR
jgi:hypothetical protein